MEGGRCEVRKQQVRWILPSLNLQKRAQKSVSYELLEDYTAKVHVGMTVLEGNWTYKEAEAGVYMAFTGSFDTVLLGRYEDGKLINEAIRPDIKITTIFKKRRKVNPILLL